MDLEKLLNEEQLKGVTCSSQYIKVVAGAGSGKTRVLTYRIAYLIQERNIYPSEIMGITFTNKAAREIRERVETLLPGVFMTQLSTIHSWCAKFLRIYAPAIEYPKNFTILDEDDQLQVMKNIFTSHGLPKNDPHIKECLNWIGAKKTEGIQYRDIAGTRYHNELINQFLVYFKEYTEILFKNASLDFDDLLLKTIQILEEEENGIRRRVQQRIKHILVDEFQDINDVQFHLIKLLMGKDTSLYVVGDPDQTIYTWRGANNKIMLDLEKNLQAEYKDCVVETIILSNNYRSSKNILDAANMLIANNLERVKKDLRAINDRGEEVSYFNARTVGEESSFVATTIYDAVKGGKKYSQFAVLYRSNHLTRELESQLNLHRVPYRLFGGQKFYQRREIKDVLAYLNLLVNPDCDVSFERIINVPKRNIGPTTVEQLKKEANDAGQSLYLYCLQNQEDIQIPLQKKKKLVSMLHILETVKEAIQYKPSTEFADIVDLMLKELEYYQYLKEEDDGDEREENVMELVGTIKEFFKVNKDATFDDFITNAALQASQDEVNDGDYVSLMTVHTAKGLEFDNVFVYGFNEGVFPSRRAIEESKRGEEEERRLAYVAITRARKKLYLTCNQDYSYVMGTNLRPSRFFKEAGIKIQNPFLFNNKYEDRYKNPFIKNTYISNEYKPQTKPAQVSSNKPQTNGVSSWAIGDKLTHEQFGVGEVIKVVSDKLIEVKFQDSQFGVKTLLSSHIKIKKLYN